MRANLQTSSLAQPFCSGNRGACNRGGSRPQVHYLGLAARDKSPNTGAAGSLEANRLTVRSSRNIIVSRFQQRISLAAQPATFFGCPSAARLQSFEPRTANAPPAGFYFGNAEADQVRGSGWFVGQFVPREFGLRRQTDVEFKWGIHPDGDKRSRPSANRNRTTISVLVQGSLRVTFHVEGAHEEGSRQLRWSLAAWQTNVDARSARFEPGKLIRLSLPV